MLRQSLVFFVLAVGLVSTSHAAGSTLAAQTSDEQGVKVMVKPQNLAQDSKTWGFEVTMETHVRDLGDEMARSAILIADDKRYAPDEWVGAPPGGHHRKGVLRFPAIVPTPRSVELQLRLSGENASRNFTWLLKGTGNGN
jgi:hypothetical protein